MTALAKRQKLTPAASDTVALPAGLAPLRNRMLKLAGAGEEAVPTDDELLGLIAEELYRNRRRRAQHFSQRLFGEPAWDILLDL